jgi:hypothetical protein
MKRRNEDDVEPVENRIATVPHRSAPNTADCGEPVDKSAACRATTIKVIFFKMIYDC